MIEHVAYVVRENVTLIIHLLISHFLSFTRMHEHRYGLTTSSSMSSEESNLISTSNPHSFTFTDMGPSYDLTTGSRRKNGMVLDMSLLVWVPAGRLIAHPHLGLDVETVLL